MTFEEFRTYANAIWEFSGMEMQEAFVFAGKCAEQGLSLDEALTAVINRTLPKRTEPKPIRTASAPAKAKPIRTEPKRTDQTTIKPLPMMESYPTFDLYCSACNNAQKRIVNGWDCSKMPDSVIDILKDYDSIENLWKDIEEHGEYLPKFKMRSFRGKRFDTATFKEWGFTFLVEGCHFGGDFALEPLRRIPN